MIVELICSSSSFPKGITICSSTGGSSCLLPSGEAVASGTRVSEEGAADSGVSRSDEIGTSSASGLERERERMVILYRLDTVNES